MFSINNEEWDLRFVSPYSSILMSPSGEYTFGVTIPERRTIYLSNELYGEMLDRVLYHELVHAEFISRGIYIPIELEECLADIISDNIVDVGFLAQNVKKNLYRYYTRF